MRRNALALSGALLMAMIGLTAAGCGGGQAGTSTPEPSSWGRRLRRRRLRRPASPGQALARAVRKTGVTPGPARTRDRRGRAGIASRRRVDGDEAASASTTTTRGSRSGSNSPPAPTGGHGGGRQVGAGHAKHPPIPSGAHGHRSRGGRSGSGGSEAAQAAGLTGFRHPSPNWLRDARPGPHARPVREGASACRPITRVRGPAIAVGDWAATGCARTAAASSARRRRRRSARAGCR